MKNTSSPDLDLDLDEAKVTFGYSTKNIPIPSRDQYTKALINKTETFVKNIRWRAFFFLNPDTDVENKETYGFKTQHAAPVLAELKDFEEGLVNMIQNVKFREVRNKFQQQLKSDLIKINKDDHLYVPADKTNNYYCVKLETYNRLMKTATEKEYKKSKKERTETITQVDKDIAYKLSLADRINITAEKEAFITLKDHKDNFRHKPTCRLLNPCKAELGKVSKQMLQRIVTTVKERNSLNLWHSTSDVIMIRCSR